MSLFAKKASEIAESGLVPDPVIRFGIRRLVEGRRRQTDPHDATQKVVAMDSFVRRMNESPVALVPEIANEQHYELPPEFFSAVLGKYRKYSCCYWGDGVETLDEAERQALEITCNRARIADGMKILDLGCGWGSLSLWIAENYPHCSVTAVSNSAPQKEFIEATAYALELKNLRVITADMNEFDIDEEFDRAVSIEMFEHMRNYRALFGRISRWLKDDGYFFMHIFCHRGAAYEYVDAGPADWMSRHFFTGGIMPSDDLPLRFQDDLVIADLWRWGGHHYRRTAEAWLDNMDNREAEIMSIFDMVYGPRDSRRWWMRWRMFFLAVSEMFGYRDGTQWRVGHFLFEQRYK
jgi:cyclopropane-fatty-acyl-phospholipid synthase